MTSAADTLSSDLPPDPDTNAAAFNLRYAVRLHQIEEARRRTVDELAASQQAFGHALTRFRNRRSWQIFLLARKLYSHCFLEGWAGRRELIRFACTAPFRGIPNLSKYDLVPPKIDAFLPKPLASAYLTEAYEQHARRIGSGLSPYDLVILPACDFDYRFQRPQHLAVQFASHGHRVFWISPDKFVDPQSPHSFVMIPLCANLWEVHLREVTPNIYMGALSAGDIARISGCIADCLQQNGAVDSCLLLQFPFWRRIGLGLRDRFGSLLTYDCMDDWQTFPDVGSFARSEEPLLGREADLLVVTARALETEFRAKQLDPVRIANGVDIELSREINAPRNQLPFPKPIIGYAGALAEWFDFDLVESVARSRPRYSFVIVGAYNREQQVGGQGVERLRTLSNVHLLGYKPFSEIPAFLAGFDVCTIPFVVNRVTQATNPVKLYEYLAAGKPVVSTPLEEVTALEPPYTYIGTTPAEFAEQLDRAIGEDTADKCEQRAAFAAANSWADRYRTFDAAIRAKKYK